MVKKFTKTTCLLLALIMCFSLSSCKKKDPTLTSATDIQIYFWNAGYGKDYMEQIVEDFNAKQSTYKAKLETDADASVILKTLELGEANTYDLYFTMVQNYSQMKDNAPLDDVLDYKVPGESKTIREKYNPAILEAQKTPDGGYRTLSSGSGLCGLIYNKSMIADDQLPRTTNELKYLVTELKGNGVTPWLFFNNVDTNGYWNFASLCWAAQYDGKEYYYDKLLKAGVSEGNGFDAEFLKTKDGRYKALKVLESVIAPDTVHDEVTSSQFTKVQSLFLNGGSAMIMNGCWLINELSKNKGTSGVKEKADNIAMMKMPVISYIVEKLEDTEMSDATLSAIVEEVDNGKTSSDKCSQKDFDRIKEARNMMFVNSAREFVFIPKYSPVLEGSKEFLKYFYSDEGLATFMNNLKLPTTVQLDDPTKFDSSSLPGFYKSQFELWKTVEPVTFRLNQSSLYNNTGMDPFLSLDYVQRLCTGNPADRKNADKLWLELQNFVDINSEVWR